MRSRHRDTWMNPELHQLVTEVLAGAQELAADERDAYLQEACAGNEDLRRELESLLAYESAEIPLLEKSIFSLRSGAPPDSADLPPAPNAGERIDRYRLERTLGQGGMGTVFLALREDDFQKKVALKVINRDLVSVDAARRFHHERQLLADLEHPYIARILDGGATTEGLPYFVMEYVEGEPIDRYCDAHKLSIRRRLELFRKVCSAVQAAHQNLVVHRDLKPGNILITAEGEPKLVDFGIAKELSPDLTAATPATTRGARHMTPTYASPEQIRGAPVTTASDVYSLGVLLYKLLTGHGPYSLDSPDLLQIVRRVCEQEPKKPSAAVEQPENIQAGDPAPDTASERSPGLEPGRLRRQLKGDLDCIVMRALRKEVRQRYGSVEQLSEDIRRHLDGMPIMARKGTFSYRSGKFVRRNKLALAALLLILSSLVTTTILWRQAVASGIKAVAAEKRAENALSFLESAFKASDPDRAKGSNPTALDILDKGRKDVEGLEDPQQQADVLDTLGAVYRNLGSYSQARELHERSVAIRRSLHPEDHAELAEAINNLAGLLYLMGEHGEAEAFYGEALAIRKRLGQERIDIAKATCNLATILMNRGAYGPAEERYLECLKIREEAHGPHHPNVAMSLRSLGTLYYTRGDLDGAEPCLLRARAIQTAALEPRHTKLADTFSTLGRLRMAQGELDEAEELFHETLDIRRERYQESHHFVALTKKDLAELHLERGDSEAARILLTEALDTLRASKLENSWSFADGESLLGAHLAGLGRYQEADPRLIDSYQTLERLRGPQAIYTRKALNRIIDLYTVWGKPDKAAEFRALAVASPK